MNLDFWPPCFRICLTFIAGAHSNIAAFNFLMNAWVCNVSYTFTVGIIMHYLLIKSSMCGSSNINFSCLQRIAENGHGSPWTFLALHGMLWKFMIFKRNLSININGLPLAFMKGYESQEILETFPTPVLFFGCFCSISPQYLNQLNYFWCHIGCLHDSYGMAISIFRFCLTIKTGAKTFTI